MDRIRPGFEQNASGEHVLYMSEMFARLMQSAAPVPVGVPRQLSPPATPPATLPPNYPALVEILTRLYQIPDGLGETVLRAEEAAAIRRCGFAARAGITWRCPPLPDALVSWNPLLRHLSDTVDPLNRPARWNPKRAPSRLIREFHPISKIERKILAKLSKEPYYMSKRQLQQKMWRYPAKFFNRTISRMIADNTI
ncbi:MAG: hypothetical protein ACRD19_17190, partial [Terriglobia bacterium]